MVNIIDDKWAEKVFEQDIVNKSMLDKIQEIVDKGTKFDFIIITGNIAFSGKREDYQVAEFFIEQLLNKTKVKKQHLYIVPGKNDINQAEVSPIHIKSIYHFENQNDITDILTSRDLLPIITKKFNDFNFFAEKAMGRQIYDQTTYHFVEYFQ